MVSESEEFLNAQGEEGKYFPAEDFAHQQVNQLYQKLGELSEEKFKEVINDSQLERFAEVIKRKMFFLNAEESLSESEANAKDTRATLRNEIQTHSASFKYSIGEKSFGMIELNKRFRDPSANPEVFDVSASGLVAAGEHNKEKFIKTIIGLSSIFKQAAETSKTDLIDLVLSERRGSFKSLSIDFDAIKKIEKKIDSSKAKLERKINNISDGQNISLYDFMTDLYKEKGDVYGFESKSQAIDQVLSMYEKYLSPNLISEIKDSLKNYSVTNYSDKDVSVANGVVPNYLKAQLEEKPTIDEVSTLAHEVAHLAVTLSNNQDDPPSQLRNYGYNLDGAVNESFSYYMQHNLLEDILSEAEAEEKPNKKLMANLLSYQMRSFKNAALLVSSGKMVVDLISSENITEETVENQLQERFNSRK